MESIEYKLIRQPRRRSLSISVSDTGEIIVKTSKTLPKKEIEAFLRKKENWIRKTLHFYKTTKTAYIPKKFVSGEKFLFLGKEYPFQLSEKKQSRGMKFNDDIFSIHVPLRISEPKEYIKDKLIGWYQNTAYKTILKRISFYETVLGASITDLRIRKLNRTWANCSRSGIVSFNWRLILAPLPILDYVVVHELCHLIHLNHSPKFWKLVEAFVPDYKERKKWLLTHDNMLKL
jgi:predicted metal-dependent hydrolase